MTTPTNPTPISMMHTARVLIPLTTLAVAACGQKTEPAPEPTPAPEPEVTAPEDLDSPKPEPAPEPAPADPDSDGDSLTDAEELDLGTDPAKADTDGDGVSDAREITQGTDPNSTDTDGDGRSDAEELASGGTNSLILNPLIADLPQGDVVIMSSPRITFNKTLGMSSEVSDAFETSTSVGTESRLSRGMSSSKSVEMSHTAGVTASVSATVGLTAAEVTAEVSASYEFSYSSTRESSSSWSRDQASTRSQALSELKSTTSGQSETMNGGTISVSARVINDGDLAWSLDDLRLAAYSRSPRTGRIIEPLPQLSVASGFPETTLDGGDQTLPLTFAADLNVDQLSAVLENPDGLTVAPASPRFLNAEGTAFAFNADDVDARTATVSIDFGIEPDGTPRGRSGRAAEQFRVAIPSQHREGLPLDTLLADLLLMEPEFGTTPWRSFESDETEALGPGLIELDGVRSSDEDTTYWTIVHEARTAGGRATVLNEYNITNESYDASEIRVNRGDTVQLVFVADRDRDGLAERTERMLGTDLDNPDTDGDGLTDGAEFIGWINDAGERVSSDPTLVDTDFDGVSDPDEMAAGTDPSTFFLPNAPAVIERLDLRVTRQGNDRRLRITLRIADSEPTGDILFYAKYGLAPSIGRPLYVTQRVPVGEDFTITIDVENAERFPDGDRVELVLTDPIYDQLNLDLARELQQEHGQAAAMEMVRTDPKIRGYLRGLDAYRLRPVLGYDW